MNAWLGEHLNFIIEQVKGMGINDILDIALVSVILFYAYRFIKERRAGKLALGIVLLFLIMVVADFLQMHVTLFFLENIFQIGIIVIIVLFQPELRSALEKVGGEPFKSLKGIGEAKDSSATLAVIKEVCDAMGDLAEEKTGALLIFERTTKLGDIVKTGTILNADVSSFLLKNIFFNKAPMHDGATIISGDRIYSAGCFLPLSLNEDIVKDLGTRHRAGIGMSENSDAVVVIVSEETGVISVAIEGKLRRGYDRETLAAELESQLLTDNIVKKFKNRKIKK
ncbi:MAG: diadenylate cyclase CdaA [Clostridia bacterium]|nr:diadenylate cyclase CdaA [Clostridia bacterium]